MKYIYFVSIMHSSGYGNVEFTSGHPFNDIQTVKDAERVISQNYNLHQVVITNFIPLRTEE